MPVISYPASPPTAGPTRPVPAEQRPSQAPPPLLFSHPGRAECRLLTAGTWSGLGSPLSSLSSPRHHTVDRQDSAPGLSPLLPVFSHPTSRPAKIISHNYSYSSVVIHHCLLLLHHHSLNTLNTLTDRTSRGSSRTKITQPDLLLGIRGTVLGTVSSISCHHMENINSTKH